MRIGQHQLFAVSANYRVAQLSVREKWSVPAEAIPRALDRLREACGLREALILSTCNRLEIYGVSSGAPPGLAEIFEALQPEALDDSRHALTFCAAKHTGAMCVHHLLRVASSLDSLVVGETEIVGQVKQAYQQAHACGATGKVLNRLFQTAFSVSKHVRTRSGIGRFSTSVGSVALDLAERVFGQDLAQHTALVLGAGKIGEATLRHFAKRGARSILIANRSLSASFQER
jgi:glutamyl-tRNA reductase